MAKTFVISGGNSGIGLDAGRQLARKGHHVVLLGRDAAKGAAAVSGITAMGQGSAEFIAADLSTHDGVRAAATSISGRHSVIHGLVLGAGVLTLKDQRTSDGLHPIFAVNFLSRYHLTQLLLPQLRSAESATVVILVAGVPLSSQINFSLFPRFEPFPGPRGLSGIQIANHHYVKYLATHEPTIRAAVANVGLVKTDIMRDMPAVLRFGFMLAGPFVTIPVERAASNATWLSTHHDWQSGLYWPRPGHPEESLPLSFEPSVVERMVEICRQLTGV